MNRSIEDYEEETKLDRHSRYDNRGDIGKVDMINFVASSKYDMTFF